MGDNDDRKREEVVQDRRDFLKAARRQRARWGPLITGAPGQPSYVLAT